MRLVSENGRSLEGICFRDGEKLMRRVMKDPVVMIAYYPQISEYNGNRQIQAVITHFH